VLPEQKVFLLRGGALGRIDGDGRPVFDAPQGLLRFFPKEEGRGMWIAGSYHRVLGWDAKGGLRHLLSVRGAVREVRGHGERLVVGFEEGGQGQVKGFRRIAEGVYEAEGAEIPVAMDRWSAFDLSPDGRLILANRVGGKGVGVWSLEDGQLLATWPTERPARILCFVDDCEIVFERGPALKGVEAAYAHPENRLLRARIQDSGTPSVIVDDFAAVLSFVRWPSRERMAFADMEGLVRVVDLGPRPHSTTLAPMTRGIPWRLRATGGSLWILLKGEEVRVERFAVE